MIRQRHDSIKYMINVFSVLRHMYKPTCSDEHQIATDSRDDQNVLSSLVALSWQG